MFISAKIFESQDIAFGWANKIALENGFNLIKACKKIFPGTGLAYSYFTCDRAGKYRARKTDRGVDMRKNTSTKKCECPFQLKLNEEWSGHYLLSVIRNTQSPDDSLF
ncbi:hypothetical protein LINPERPRIM_LOCUS28836 [Linum perenne]